MSLTGAASALSAQKPARKHAISLGDGVNIPLGDNGFLNKTNPTAPFVAYSYAVSGNFSVGVRAGYAYSREKGETRDRYDNALVDGYSDRKLTLIPLQVELRYFLFGGAKALLNPFVVVAGGAQYSSYFITGEYISTAERSDWSYVVTPGVGVRIVPCRSGMFHLDIMADWQYAGNQWPLTASRYHQFIGIKLAAGLMF